MFDVGFSELLVIAVVALVVIGPERLPRVARTAGHLLGRLQRYVGDVKADISREMQLEELKKMQEQIVAETRDMESRVNEQMAAVETSLNDSIGQGLSDKAAEAAPAQSPDVASHAEHAVMPAPTIAESSPAVATPDKHA